MVIKKDISNFKPFLKYKRPPFAPLLPQVKEALKGNKK